MKNRHWLAPMLALGLIGTPAFAGGGETPEPAREEARIPFVNHGGIRDWRFGDRETLYVQDRQRDWYEARLMSPVIGWRGEWAIGFDTGTIGTFDRFSSVVVDGWRYPVMSLVRLEGEPPRRG